MAANAPIGVVKIDGTALQQSIKNSSLSKVNSWDNMPQPAVDVFEDAANSMKVPALKKMLKTYYPNDSKMTTKINLMKRGDNSSSPGTLMSSIVNYWKLNFLAPPEDTAIAELTPLEREILKMSVPRLREILLEANAGDDDKCDHIKKEKRSGFDRAESLVSMMAEVMKQRD